MKRLTVFVFALLVGIGVVANAEDFKRAITFEDNYDAACRITVSGSRGSGTLIGSKDGKAFILTCYHVVTNKKDVLLEWEKPGFYKQIPGTVVWKAYDANIPYDFAVIQCDLKQLKNEVDPCYIPIAGIDGRAQPGSFIISAGAPKGHYISAWKGNVLGYYNNRTMEFKPAPYPGQSGSGVISYIDGKPYLVAVLTWLIGNEGQDSSKGGAIPIANLYSALKKTPFVPVSNNPNESPIPPDATECNDIGYKILDFTQNNCKPCEDIKGDIEKLISDGNEVDEINISTADGSLIGAAYAISATPTIVVVDRNDNEIGRCIGSENVYEKITKLINEDKKNYIQEEPEELVENNKFEFDESFKNNTEQTKEEKQAENCYGGVCYVIKKKKQEDNQDFRNREPVQEEFDDAGFFDEQLDNWNSRNKNNKEKQEESKTERKILGNNDNGLVNRIISGIKDEIVETVDNSVNNAKQKIIGNRFKILFCLMIFVVVSVWIADSLKGFVKVCFNKIKEFNCNIITQAAKNILEKYEKDGKD